MKNKQKKNSNSGDTLALALIFGFMVGVLLNMVALGLIVGLLFGCLLDS